MLLLAEELYVHFRAEHAVPRRVRRRDGRAFCVLPLRPQLHVRCGRSRRRVPSVCGRAVRADRAFGGQVRAAHDGLVRAGAAEVLRGLCRRHRRRDDARVRVPCAVPRGAGRQRAPVQPVRVLVQRDRQRVLGNHACDPRAGVQLRVLRVQRRRGLCALGAAAPRALPPGTRGRHLPRRLRGPRVRPSQS
eukprot:Amastigsp_a676354_2257.p3 type:complete len:190 gc:universal Amastigsp_a676354_2257:820-251(-)